MARTAKVSIREVARAAGVSVTTVSHALNGKGRVQPATRALVAETAARLGYHPNRAASGLRSGRTNAVGLSLPSDADLRDHDRLLEVDFFMEVTLATVRASFDADHALVMLPPIRTRGELGRLAVDGGLVVSTRYADPRITLFESLGLPVVALDPDPTRPDFRWWVTDRDPHNTTHMLDHLAEVGARRIALLSVASEWTWFGETTKTFLAWSREHGRDDVAVDLTPDRRPETAAAAVHELLDGANPPDAVFAMSQWAATGVLRAARDRGLRVPHDLRVSVGVDSQAARTSDPPLTAVDLRPAESAARALDVLLDRLAGRDDEPTDRVRGELLVRASTSG